MTFEEYYEAEPELYNASNYLPQIRMMHELFSPDSVLLLLFDDLIKKPGTTLQKVFNFLGVEDLSMSITKQMVHANNSKKHVGYMIRAAVLKPFQRITALRRLYDAMPRDFRERLVSSVLNSSYGRRVGNRFTPRPMQPGTRRALIEQFSPSFNELEQAVGADLSAWLDPRDPGAAIELSATTRK
jgi:Sulfotransferase domain